MAVATINKNFFIYNDYQFISIDKGAVVNASFTVPQELLDTYSHYLVVPQSVHGGIIVCSIGFSENVLYITVYNAIGPDRSNERIEINILFA